MLGQIDVKKVMGKKEYDEKMEKLEVRFGELQRECKEKGIAIMRYDEFFSAVDSAFGSSDIYGKLGVSDAEKFKETAKKLKKDE